MNIYVCICLCLSFGVHFIDHGSASAIARRSDEPSVHFVELTTKSNNHNRMPVEEHFEKTSTNSTQFSQFMQELQKERESAANAGVSDQDLLTRFSNKLADLKRRFTYTFISSDSSTTTTIKPVQSGSWLGNAWRRVTSGGKKSPEEVRETEIRTFLSELDREIENVDHKRHHQNVDRAPVIDLPERSPEVTSSRTIIGAPQRCGQGTRRDLAGVCRPIVGSR